MKSLKIATVALGMMSLTACGLGDGSASCSDRFCLSEQTLELDQSDIIGSSDFQSNSVSAQGLLDDLISLTPNLTLVGSLAAPYVNGAQVQASDITVSGTKVYVAYNTAGNTQAGAVDVIDISTPTNLKLLQDQTFSSMDIHKVAVNGGKLYTAGADANGARLQRITLDASGKLTSNTESVALPSTADPTIPAYAATSVIVAGSYIYATGGNNGGLSVLNIADMSEKHFLDIPDARDISFDSNASSVYIVTGKTASANAQVKHVSLTATALGSGNTTLANAQIDEAKSTIQTGASMQVVTAGYGGARLICIGSGATLGLASNPVVSGLAASKTTANAAAFGGGYMYVANGEAGVSIYSVNVPLIPLGCNLVSITYLGRLSLGTGASVNNVFYTNGYLVAAVGTGGFKIIKVSTSLLSGLLQAL